MAKINVYREPVSDMTSVPNVFIDEYMPVANGDYVKIYLYLLRNLNNPDVDFSLPQMADYFDCTERDVVRGLKYWEKQQLLRLEFDQQQNLTGICFLQDAFRKSSKKETDPIDITDRIQQTRAYQEQQQAREAQATTEMHVNVASHVSQEDVPEERTESAQYESQESAESIPAPTIIRKKSYTMEDIRRFCESDDVQEMVFITEQYLGRTVGQNDLNTIFFWYDELHFSAELIEYLIEYCVSRGHKSFHYMQRVAEDLAMRGIREVADAKEVFRQDNEYYHAIMQAFGIRGRNLVPAETSYIKIWSQQMGFSVEMVAEACNRTIRATHEPKFGYANSILESWQKQNIKTLEDVKKADEAFQQSQKGRQEKAVANSSRFVNFNQRDNDYRDLQQQLLKKSMQ